MTKFAALFLLCGGVTAACAQSPLWTATQQAPVLVADQPWEGSVVAEPTVLRGADGLYRMWYTGGWADCAVGLATSPNGLTWTKYAGNPIVGRGHADVNTACHSHVFFDNGIYYLYFANDTIRGELYVATSRDGVSFSLEPGPILRAPSYWSRGNLGNTFVWRDGDIYWMATEAQGKDWMWRTGPARSSSPLGPFTQLPNGVSTQTWPSLCPRGAYGHPWITENQGRHDIWYHCAPIGDLPTDIWHAYSLNGITVDKWRRDSMPIIAHSGTGWTFDQVADPSLAPGPHGTMLLYYSGMNNAAPSGAIGVAALLQ